MRNWTKFQDGKRFNARNHGMFLTLIGLVVLAGPIPIVQADQSSSTIVLDRPMHFTGSDSQDLVVEPGEYRVEAQESQLRLTPADGKASLLIQASPTTHEETVSAPVVMVITEEGNDDQAHLVLLLPEHTGLEAVGSLNGITSRGTSFSRLSRVQMQSAYAQQRQTAESPKRLQPIKVAPAVGKQKRPLTAQSGPGTVVTWQYFHRYRPDIVAQALADVQTGKRPLDSVSGLVDPTQLPAMLKTDWSAEAARLKAVGAEAAKQASITSRGISGIAANQSALPKVTAPIPPLRSEQRAPTAFTEMLPPYPLGNTYSGERYATETYFLLPQPFDGVLQCRLDDTATANRFRVTATRPISGIWKAGSPFNPALISNTSVTETLKTSAGYEEVRVKAFEQAGCRVFFEPDPGAGPPAGRYEVALEMDFTPVSPANRAKKLVMPILVNHMGINFDILAYAEVGHADTLTETVVEMPIIITNASGVPKSGAIRAEQLPPGVVMEPTPDFLFGGPGTQRHVLRFRVNKAARDGPAQPIVVNVGGRRRIPLSLTIYHPIVFWSYGDEGRSNDFPGLAQPKGNDIRLWTLDITLRDDGTWWWEAKVGNSNIIDIGGTDIHLDIRFIANPSVGDNYSKNLGPGHETWRHDLGHAWLRDNYLIAAERGVTVNFCCYDY